MKRLVMGWLAALAAAGSLAAGAQAFPAKPIKLIVPLAAGGTGDTATATTPHEFAAPIAEEEPLWGQGIKESGAKVDR